jgi:hypothetical protein
MVERYFHHNFRENPDKKQKTGTMRKYGFPGIRF